MPSQAFLAELGLYPVCDTAGEVEQAGPRMVSSAEEFTGAAAVVFQLAEERGFPELYTHGRYHGRGRGLWARFCREAAPAWMALAEAALREKAPAAGERE